MPDNVFQLNTGSAGVNLGAQGKAISWRRIRAFIMTPLSYFLDPGDVASMQALKTELQAAVINADSSQRIQIMETIQESEAQGSDPVQQSFGYGLNKTVYSGQYGMRAFFGDDNLAKHQKRQQFNKRAGEFLVMLIDEDQQLICTKGDDGTGKVVLVGFSMADFLADNNAMDFGEGAKQSVNISFSDPNEFNNGNLMIEPCGFNVIKTIKNVTDIVLTAVSAVSTRVVSVAPMAMNGNIGTNLAAVYPTVLAGSGTALTLWKGRDRATGLPLTLTSAVKATLNGVDVITLTWAATNFPTAPGKIDVYLDTPANLATAGLKPAYESNILTLDVV